MKCKKCGVEIKEGMKFCPECGEKVDPVKTSITPPPEPEAVMNQDKTKNLFKDKKNIIIVVLAIIIVCGIVYMAGSAGNKDHSNNSSGTITEKETKKEDKEKSENNENNTSKENNVSSNVTKNYKNITGGSLSAGTYTVGHDLEPGIYDFVYTTNMSEDDYWGNDYLWITRSGSEGKNETLGGDKFDDRYGAFDYSLASSGSAKCHVTLNEGDTVKVDSEDGQWSY